MSLTDHYANQRPWRDWDTALASLPRLDGARVLDLGCGIGDQAALLVERGASVVGIDANEEVLDVARGRGLPRTRFVSGDLRLPVPGEAPFDGIWTSFAAAYFVDFVPVLAAWARQLRRGGWIAVTEIDDLFAHEPVAPRTRELFGLYVADAFTAGRYDFRMGRKLAAHLAAAGYVVEFERDLADHEFAFQGPALPEVVRAWSERFELMRLLRVRFGDEFESVRADFLAGLASTNHRSSTRVVFTLARWPG